MRRASLCAAGWLLVAGMVSGACAPKPSGSEAAGESAGQTTKPAAGAVDTLAWPVLTDAKPREYPGIRNAVAFDERLISGSVPDAEAGFDSLARLGVRTIISVDGAVPQVAQAEARGMRYIHLPIGYKRIDPARQLELMRAIRDGLQRGPIYLHCHRGKHRSAAAAAVALVGLGKAEPEQMTGRMTVSGTSLSYQGLWACAREATVIDRATIDAVPSDLPSVSRPTGMVEAMVAIDETLDQLEAIQKAGWRPPADHPDLVPTAEAGRLAEVLRVLAEGDQAIGRSSEFVGMMRASQTQAAALEAWLLSQPTDLGGLTDRMASLAASCKDCHVRYRD